MQCANCGYENPDRAKFCGSCETPLQNHCSGCGFANPAGFKFCGQCGASLTEKSALKGEPSPDAAEAERRQLTVMFCDLVGSTPLSERLDPEILREILRDYQAVCKEVIDRFEGYLARYFGDGLLVYFGYPQAHDDDARRAVRSGLDIVTAMAGLNTRLETERDFRLDVRIGIHTGLVVAGDMDAERQLESMAIVGEVPNVGDRLQKLADPNTVVVSAATHRLIEGYFECENLGLRSLPGVSESMEVYRVVRASARTRMEAASERGLSPFVGRQQELAVLHSYLAHARRGLGQVVFVSGEAGIGKSRLLLEFRHSIRDGVWLEGQCIPYGRQTPYLPLIDLLRDVFGLEEGDDEARTIRRVDEKTTGWDAAARGAVPYLKYLLHVDPGDAAISALDPRERRAGILNGLRALLEQECRRGVAVVAIEDLHWIDAQSEQALSALVDAVASVPAMLILSHRPGYVHSMDERIHFRRLSVGQLPREESGALARGMLHASVLPGAFLQVVHKKAEGNPFYIEELTRSLIESGVLRQRNGDYVLEKPIESVDVPDTIQEVILGRIDRLGQQSREALRLASVIGREFAVRLLNRISNLEGRLECVLKELNVLELIFQTACFPELAYMFKHALTHDVAYGTLLMERRKTLHRTVAEAIEELYADRLADYYGMLAYHYAEGEVWEKALGYLVKAGDQAAATYANREALDHYARALEVCEKLDDSATAAAVSGKRGGIHFATGNLPEAIEDFDRMRDAARKREDPHLEGMGLALRGWTEFWNHEYEKALATSSSTLNISEGFDDVKLLANVTLGLTLYGTGRIDEARPYHRAAEALAPGVSDLQGQAFWFVTGWHPLEWEGRFDDTLSHLAQWKNTVEKTGNAFLILGYRWLEALPRAGKGEYEKALALLKDVLVTADRIGDSFWKSRALNTVGWIYGELQDFHRAIAWNTRGIRAGQEAGSMTNQPNSEVENNAHLNLADNLMALGRLDEAEAHFQAVERVARNPRAEDRLDLWRYAQHLFHSYGELCLIRGNREKALAYANECLTLAEPGNHRKNIVKGKRLKGQMFLSEGKLADAEAEILKALEIAKEVGNPPQLWKTYAALGELKKAQERSEDSQAAYQEALGVIEEVAGGLMDESLKKTFLNSHYVQNLRNKLEGTAHR